MARYINFKLKIAAKAAEKGINNKDRDKWEKSSTVFYSDVSC